MVEDLGYSGHRLGYYAGGLAASFCGAQFISSMSWGIFSDKYGRKPAVVIGTLGAAVGMFIFGSAKTYTQAVLGRIIGGLLNGNIGVLKSFLTEITDDSNRGKGFSYMSIAWAAGTIIAPLTGGLLSNPAQKYPYIFSDSSLFAEYPYLLPCLLCSISNVLSSVACMVFMTETRGVNAQKKPSTLSYRTRNRSISSEIQMANIESPNGKMSEYLQRGKSAILTTLGAEQKSSWDYSRLPTVNESKVEAIHDGTKINNTVGFAESESNTDLSTLETANSGATIEEFNGQTTSLTESPTAVKDLESGSDDDKEIKGFATSDSEMEYFADKRLGIFMGETFVKKASYHFPKQRKVEEDEILCCATNDPTCGWFPRLLRAIFHTASPVGTDSGGKKLFVKKSSNTGTSVLRHRSVILAVTNYGLLAMGYILLDETLPLFLKLDMPHGGFAFGSSEIGFMLATSGAGMLVFTTMALPLIARNSKLWMFNVGILGAIPLAFGWPLLAVFNYHVVVPNIHNPSTQKMIMWFLLITLCILKNVMATLSFTAVMILVNHSVVEDYLGLVNGLGQSMAALMRGVGPALGGLLWSLAIKENFVYFNFMGVAAIFALTMLINRQLPASLDYKKVKK